MKSFYERLEKKKKRRREKEKASSEITLLTARGKVEQNPRKWKSDVIKHYFEKIAVKQ